MPLAPSPLFLNRDSYGLPVVVQGWIDGNVVAEAPRSDDEWQEWLGHLAQMHSIAPLPGESSLSP